MPELYILILKILDLYKKIYNINVRTIEYFKVYLGYISVKLILNRLEHKIQSYNRVQEVPGSNPTRGFAWELLLRQTSRQYFFRLTMT